MCLFRLFFCLFRLSLCGFRLSLCVLVCPCVCSGCPCVCSGCPCVCSSCPCVCSGARSGEGDQQKSDTTAAVTGGKPGNSRWEEIKATGGKEAWQQQQQMGRKPGNSRWEGSQATAGGKEAKQQQVGRKPGNSRWEGSQATAGGKEAWQQQVVESGSGVNTHTILCPQHAALLRQSSQSNTVPDLPTPSAAIVCTDVLSFTVTLA